MDPKPLIILAGHLETHVGATPIYGQKTKYIESVISAGGLPLVIAPNLPVEDLAQLIDEGDGFMLCGGGDLEPDRYGGACRVRLGGVNEERDQFEIAFLHRVLQSEKPLLGICRGVQVMNVGLGGSLFCDIESQIKGSLKHDWYPKYDRSKPRHEVQLNKDSLLVQILGMDRIQTNSLHHQALDRVGEGLVVTARSADGIIEAVEMPGKKFVVGVQWHPEWMQNAAEMRALFSAFVEASKDN